MRSKGKNSNKVYQEVLGNLASKGYKFRYNIITGNVEFSIQPNNLFKSIDDYELNSLINELWDEGLPILTGDLMVLLKSKYSEIYDPIKQYYETLKPWDGQTDYLGQLANTVTTTNPEFWEKYFKKWLVATVASAINDEIVNHTMLIFTGQQGIGKTTWLNRLLSKELAPYIYTGNFQLGNKDTEIYLAQSMLVILDEFQVYGKRSQDKLKELITRPHIRVRRPYERFAENFTRRASFCASTNDEEFLTDFTGNRRFLCFQVLSIDYISPIDIDQVHAQAYALVKNGFEYWLNEEEAKEVSQINERFTNVSLEEELLIKYFEPCDLEEASHILMTSEIAEAISKKHSRIGINNSTIRSLGIALSRRGFMRISHQDRKKYALKECK